jgi:hypothetical protein
MARPISIQVSQRRAGVLAFAVFATIAAVLSLWSLAFVPFMFLMDDNGTPVPQLLGTAAMYSAPPLLFALAAVRAWSAAPAGRLSRVALVALPLALAVEVVVATPVVVLQLNPKPTVTTLYASNGKPCYQVIESTQGVARKVFPGNPCDDKFTTAVRRK